MVTHPAGSLAQDRESSPAKTSVLTTMLRRLYYILVTVFSFDAVGRMTGRASGLQKYL